MYTKNEIVAMNSIYAYIEYGDTTHNSLIYDLFNSVAREGDLYCSTYPYVFLLDKNYNCYCLFKYFRSKMIILTQRAIYSVDFPTNENINMYRSIIRRSDKVDYNGIVDNCWVVNAVIYENIKKKMMKRWAYKGDINWLFA